MHIKSETRRLLKRRSTKVVVVLLTAVLAIQSVNLPAIAMALPDGDNLATVDDTQATTPATTTGDEGTTTETEGNTPEVQGTDTTATDPATTSTDQQAAAATPADSTGSTATDSAAATTPDTQAAPAEDTTATISLNLNESSLTYSEQTYQSDATTLEAPAQQELKFTVAPVDGYQVDTVKQVVNGVETELTADENGIYTIAADAVADGLAINVATSEVPPAEEAPAEEPATEGDENAAADESATENGDESATDDAANAEEATEGDETTDEATAGDEIVNKVASLMSTLSSGVSTFAGANISTIEIEKGSEKQLSTNSTARWTQNHSWKSSDSGIVAISGRDNQEDVTIIGKSEGTTTITHTWEEKDHFFSSSWEKSPRPSM